MFTFYQIIYLNALSFILEIMLVIIFSEVLIILFLHLRPHLMAQCIFTQMIFLYSMHTCFHDLKQLNII